ncbi:LacI family DNA-binding transcriptional regulator [Ohessyouella blattaphilus]|uniref:LacI family transcriptional regulator n=1 Tax=Ohessyouella blattaphilus TaxID=2949333 RepID=A0ABT1EK39_9FIRM|nr:LacI family DNA-binding transcriptional regulator [Ohessyouella blattaphilus]MCP1111067.1 LacI family transcriptional regulator [Ohessyouella blattaphilus]MCR8564461.1 LacI family transcriptional regulator [Ohessyouella blattaphilus]
MEVTIKDVARRCNVAVSTVSRAINNHPDINPQTKAEIMQAIEELNYVPNNSARNLKRSDNKTIAVLVKGISNQFFNKLVTEIEKEIRTKKYTFFLQHVDEHANEVDIAVALTKEKRLRGIVFLGGYEYHTKESLSQLTVPFVTCTTSDFGNNEECVCSSYAVDDYKESYKMTEYLIRQGHKRIVLLGPMEHDESIGRRRLEGYQAALKDNHIDLDEKLIRYMAKNVVTYSMRNGYVVMQEALKEKLDFTAVFAISDLLAIGACKAIFEAGKKIPEDYAVAGFDGIDETFYYEPSITTIRQPIKELTTSSMQALFRMIKSKESVPGVIFAGELIERASTNPNL